MYIVSIEHSYNRLNFYFEELTEAYGLIQCALREGYKVEITTTKKEELDF